MKNKLTTIVWIVLSGLVGLLGVQNYFLRKELKELSKPKETQEVTIKPDNPQTRPANPPATSPFDKPNVDPLANQFPPDSPGPKDMTTVKFDKMTHDFGRINEGDIVKTKFHFTNTGNKPLLITHAQGSCGCTVPDWPRDPVKPGASADINVQFDSHDKRGETQKTVTVVGNLTPGQIVLTIKATVIPRDK